MSAKRVAPQDGAAEAMAGSGAAHAYPLQGPTRSRGAFSAVPPMATPGLSRSRAVPTPAVRWRRSEAESRRGSALLSAAAAESRCLAAAPFPSALKMAFLETYPLNTYRPLHGGRGGSCGLPCTAIPLRAPTASTKGSGGAAASGGPSQAVSPAEHASAWNSLVAAALLHFQRAAAAIVGAAPAPSATGECDGGCPPPFRSLMSSFFSAVDEAPTSPFAVRLEAAAGSGGGAPRQLQLIDDVSAGPGGKPQPPTPPASVVAAGGKAEGGGAITEPPQPHTAAAAPNVPRRAQPAVGVPGGGASAMPMETAAAAADDPHRFHAGPARPPRSIAAKERVLQLLVQEERALAAWAVSHKAHLGHVQAAEHAAAHATPRASQPSSTKLTAVRLRHHRTDAKQASARSRLATSSALPLHTPVAPHPSIAAAAPRRSGPPGPGNMSQPGTSPTSSAGAQAEREDGQGGGCSGRGAAAGDAESPVGALDVATEASLSSVEPKERVAPPYSPSQQPQQQQHMSKAPAGSLSASARAAAATPTAAAERTDGGEARDPVNPQTKAQCAHAQLMSKMEQVNAKLRAAAQQQQQQQQQRRHGGTSGGRKAVDGFRGTSTPQPRADSSAATALSRSPRDPPMPTTATPTVWAEVPVMIIGAEVGSELHAEAAALRELEKKLAASEVDMAELRLEIARLSQGSEAERGAAAARAYVSETSGESGAGEGELFVFAVLNGSKSVATQTAPMNVGDDGGGSGAQAGEAGQLEAAFHHEADLRASLRNVAVAVANMAGFQRSLAVDVVCQHCLAPVTRTAALACGHSFCARCVQREMYVSAEEAVCADCGRVSAGFASNATLDSLAALCAGGAAAGGAQPGETPRAAGLLGKMVESFVREVQRAQAGIDGSRAVIQQEVADALQEIARRHDSGL